MIGIRVAAGLLGPDTKPIENAKGQTLGMLSIYRHIYESASIVVYTRRFVIERRANTLTISTQTTKPEIPRAVCGVMFRVAKTVLHRKRFLGH